MTKHYTKAKENYEQLSLPEKQQLFGEIQEDLEKEIDAENERLNAKVVENQKFKSKINGNS